MKEKRIDNFGGEYAFLSNLYESPVLAFGLRYKSAEAAFQAQKVNDIAVKSKFTKMDAQKAMAEGHRLKITVPDWTLIRKDIMYVILTEKFKQNSDLANRLLSTQNAEIVATNDWGDTYWGVCNGEGENNLGKALMRVRKRLLELRKKDEIRLR